MNKWCDCVATNKKVKITELSLSGLAGQDILPGGGGGGGGGEGQTGRLFHPLEPVRPAGQ